MGSLHVWNELSKLNVDNMSVWKIKKARRVMNTVGSDNKKVVNVQEEKCGEPKQTMEWGTL